MEPRQAQEEYRQGVIVTLVGSAVNVLLIVIKVWGGLAAQSQALLADGVHSVSDLLSDAVVLLGLSWGRMEPDANHPFGHGRIETLAAMLVGCALVAAAGFMGGSAGSSIVQGQTSVPGSLAIYIAGFSILAKEGLYWYTRQVGQKIGSAALLSNAWHHRSDALSSIAVLIGVIAARINPQWAMLDAVAAIVVALLVGRVGLGFIISAFKEFIDTAPEPEVVDSIQHCALHIEGVRDVHDLRARTSGGKVFVEIHVTVDRTMSVEQGHAVAKSVEQCLIRDVPHLTKAIVHIDPSDRNDSS